MLHEVCVEVPVSKSVNACSGLNGISVHEQRIDFQRAEVPVGQNANERTAFQLSPHYRVSRWGYPAQPSRRPSRLQRLLLPIDFPSGRTQRRLSLRRRTAAKHGAGPIMGVVRSSPERSLSCLAQSDLFVERRQIVKMLSYSCKP